MDRRLFLQSLAGITTIIGTVTSADAVSHRPLLMGIFPRRNAKTTYRMLSPMANYLSAQLGIEVRLAVEKNFDTFWQHVKDKKYDIVHFNQYHYVVAHQHYGYQTILMNQEHGKSTISGSIVVRKDSKINELKDLKGKTIIFGGGPRAMQSYIIATWLLKQAGLSKDDYETKFARNPPNALISTYNKMTDAACAGDVVLELNVVKNNIDISEMKHLAKSEPSSHLPWATSDKISATLSLRIKKILSELHTLPFGKRILERAELTALVPAEDKDYDQARRIIMDIYGEDYGINKL